MAWARPPGAPQLPSNPIELLEPKENDYRSLYDLYGLQTAFALVGFFGPGFSNIGRKRPFYASIWKHVICGIALGYLGIKLQNFREVISADKDEVLRQYVNLHPQDFPPYERKLIKNTIISWEPFR